MFTSCVVRHRTELRPAPRAVGLSLVVLCGLMMLVCTVQAVPLYAPVFHLYEAGSYARPVSAPFRDAKTSTVHVYVPCAAGLRGRASTRWSHYTSRNYVSWTRETSGVALRAGKWYDEGGVEAGTLTLNAQDEPTIMYTCVGRSGTQRQCVAGPPSHDLDDTRTLSQLRKSPLNPVLSSEDVPNLVGLDSFRDPTAWWRRAENGTSSTDSVEETWLIGFAASLRENSTGLPRPHVVLFMTMDSSLEGGYGYSHSLYTDATTVDTMFDYPDFFIADGAAPLDGTDAVHFLKLSSPSARRDYVLRGSYASPSGSADVGAAEAVFTADANPAAVWVDFGTLYGSKTFWDPLLRRRRLWGWVDEDVAVGSAATAALSWGGVQTLRDVVYNETDGTMRFSPIGEWKALRSALVFKGSATLRDGATSVEMVAAAAGATRYHEIIADFTFPGGYLDGSQYYTEESAAPEIGLRLRANGDGTRYVSVALAMPTVNATPSRCYTQAGHPLQTFTLPDVANDTALCRAACEALPLCTAWDRVSRAYETVCVLYWQSSEPQQNCSVTTGRPNVPLLRLSRARSGTLGAANVLEGRAPLASGRTQSMRLHIYVDDSVIEVFKDEGKECVTGRVYLDDATQDGIWVYAKNMPAASIEVNVRVFRMGSIWDSPAAPGAVEKYIKSSYNLLSALIVE